MTLRLWIQFPILVSLVASIEATASTGPIRFDDLPRLVQEKNENVQAARSTLKAHQERTGVLARSFLPRLSADIGGEKARINSSPIESESFWILEARVNIYRGGRDRLESQIRESNARAAKTDFSLEFQEELKAARQAYWSLIATRSLIQDRKESLGKNDENLKSARRRAGAGVATAADAVQFELQKTLLTQELKKLELQADLLRNRLSVALGLDEHEGLEVESGFPHPEESPLQVATVDPMNTLAIRSLKGAEIVDRARQDQASRWWRPNVDVYSSYGVPSLSDEFTRAARGEREWVAGVKLGFDLGESFEARAEARAKAADVNASASRLAHRRREVIAADHELRHDLRLLHELIHDADKDIEKAERFLKLTQSEYVRGVKNGPDLLDAFQKLYEFRQRRTELYRDYHSTHAELLALTANEAEL